MLTHMLRQLLLSLCGLQGLIQAVLDLLVAKESAFWGDHLSQLMDFQKLLPAKIESIEKSGLEEEPKASEHRGSHLRRALHSW